MLPFMFEQYVEHRLQRELGSYIFIDLWCSKNQTHGILTQTKIKTNITAKVITTLGLLEFTDIHYK